MTGMLSLPDHLLEMITARTATGLSEYKEAWGAAAVTCKRLHNVQLPGEYVAVRDYHSLPWLLPRLRDVKGLHLDACHDTFQTFTSKRSLRQSVSLLLGATSRLSQLQTLVLTGHLRPLIPWTMELLMSASSLRTLQYNVYGVPCPPILRRLPLKHLILTVRSDDELHNMLDDLSYCQSLESLSLSACASWLRLPVPELPSLDLSGALKLRHVKFTDLVPCVPGELLLPPGCVLSLAGRPARSSRMRALWSARWVARPDMVKVLSMHIGGGLEYLTPQDILTHRPVDLLSRPCPKRVETFPALQMLRLDYFDLPEPLELAVFAHIPCLSLRSRRRLDVTIKEGSWQLLELEGRGEFKLSILDMHSFLRSVHVFAFTFPNAQIESVMRVVEVCQCLHVPLHEQQHQAAADSWTAISTTVMQGQQLTTLSNDKRFVGDLDLDSTALMGVWPAELDPGMQSARWAWVERAKQEVAPPTGSLVNYRDYPWQWLMQL